VNTIQINESLSLFVDNGTVSIGRDDGGLVRLEAAEFDALISLWAEAEMAKLRAWANLWKQAAKEWRQAALEAQAAQGPRVPVVGTLSADTTPDDFKRFANGS
jgi:hypothetical protein